MTTTLFFNGTIRPTSSTAADWLLLEGKSVTTTGPGDGPGSEVRVDRRVDLHGGTLVPAFCDAHVHLPATGLYAAGMNFRGVHATDQILDAFSDRAGDSGALLFGGNFEDPLDKPLDRRDLDRAVGDRPALLARADMHSSIVSSTLLNSLELRDEPGIDRDPSGEPTGYLREQAAGAAWRWFEHNLPRNVQVEAIRAAAKLAYSKGFGSVHEMFVVEWRGWDSFDVFREAVEPLSLNVTVYLGTDEVDKVRSLGYDRIGGDYFLDGAFGSHTAWMIEPFSSTPPVGTPATGISYRTDDEVYAFFSAAQRAGLQVGAHAIGDAAIEQAIATWERVASDVGREAVMKLRHRIEHFECASDDHIARAARLGLQASVQPAFDAFWGGSDGMYSKRIGWERAAQMNRFGSMARAGLAVGAGSDSTVTPMDPFVQMKALRAHHVVAERLSAKRALAMATLGAHALVSQDDERGQMQAGSVADLAWLDRDPLTTDDDELTKTEVLGTWIGGQRVWPPEEAESA